MSALLEPTYITSKLSDSKNVKSSAVFSPQVWLTNSSSPSPTDVVIDAASWTSLVTRVKQLELQNARVTNIELKLTSLIQSVRTILIYLNELKVAVELLDSTGATVNPPPVPP
jgi:hypothetical protein